MKKNRMRVAMIGALINIVTGTLFALSVVRHTDWEHVTLTPGVSRIAYYENLLHVLCERVVAAAVIVMFLSAILFWILRKN
jgi:hypothetical protein